MSALPPWIWRRLLRLLLPAGVRDDVLADMEERHGEITARHGRRAATRWYRRHALLSLRPAVRARAPVLFREDAARRPSGWLDAALQDVGYALRQGRRRPGFVLVCLLTLTLGVGSATAIYAVVHGVLLAPLPYDEPDRIVRTYTAVPDEPEGRNPIALLEIAEALRRDHYFAAMAGLDLRSVSLTGGGRPARVRATLATRELFRVFGVPPLLGRTFGPGDHEPGSDVAVLSHGLWQRRLGGDPDVVGESLEVDGERRTIIGVMPPSFDFYVDSDLWMPLVIDVGGLERASIRSHGHAVVARMPAAGTVAVAEAAWTELLQEIVADYPEHDGSHVGQVVSLDEVLTGGVRPALLAVLAAVLLLLVVVCVNLANVMLARAEERRRDVSLRLALGAGAGRIVRQLLTESLVLGLVGGGLGILLARLCRDLLVALMPVGMPRLDAIEIGAPVLGFGLLLSVLASLAFGLAPALRAGRSGSSRALREGGRGAAGRGGADGARSALIVAEVALVMALMVAAGLMVRSVARLAAVDPGVATEGVFTLELSLPEARYPSDVEITRFYDDLVGRLGRLPEVERAGAVSWMPFARFPSNWTMDVEGRDDTGEPAPLVDYALVVGDYFAAVGIPLLRGRTFRPEDRGAAVVVVDERTAELFWPGDDPLGRRLRFQTSDRWRTVVGVVAGHRNRGLAEEPEPGLYIPLERLGTPGNWIPRGMDLALRVDGEPGTVAGRVRELVWDADPALPVEGMAPMAAHLSDALAGSRFTMRLLAFFAAVSLALGAVGIYGIVSWAVVRRTREIGIRMALGAPPARVLRRVVGNGLTRVGLGLGLGLLLAWVGARLLLAGLLFEVDPVDPLTFATVAVVLLLVSLGASLVPAARAVRIDPRRTLQEE